MADVGASQGPRDALALLEIIEPDAANASPAGTDRYIMLVQGPFAYVPGEGEQYITATRRDGRRRIAPNTTAYPRQGTSPGAFGG
jgi:hypothetical protein